MANIKVVASNTMNLYFQDYPETSQFFDGDDFLFHVGAMYASLLGQEYNTEYAKMAAEGEGNLVSFSHDWISTFEGKREKDADGFFIKLPSPVMSFPYDRRDIGIQDIFPANKMMANEYIRSSIGDIWQNKFLPATTNVFWALLKDKIYLYTNLGEPPLLSKVVYVPGISDELEIPDTRVFAIMANTIDVMRKAAANYVVAETADGNLNNLPQTDADRNLIK